MAGRVTKFVNTSESLRGVSSRWPRGLHERGMTTDCGLPDGAFGADAFRGLRAPIGLCPVAFCVLILLRHSFGGIEKALVYPSATHPHVNTARTPERKFSPMTNSSARSRGFARKP